MNALDEEYSPQGWAGAWAYHTIRRNKAVREHFSDVITDHESVVKYSKIGYHIKNDNAIAVILDNPLTTKYIKDTDIAFFVGWHNHNENGEQKHYHQFFFRPDAKKEDFDSLSENIKPFVLYRDDVCKGASQLNPFAICDSMSMDIISNTMPEIRKRTMRYTIEKIEIDNITKHLLIY